jgi:ATP-dependent phosphoenolpyruvate carboxykinase
MAFNFEGFAMPSAYLKQEHEPQIFNAIKFGSVLENVVMIQSRGKQIMLIMLN